MKKAYIYIALTTLLFSTIEIALKLVTSGFNPIQMTFLRFFIGAIVLTPLAIKSLKNRKISLNKEDIKFFMLQGFICIVVSMSLYQLAIIYNTASIVAVLFSCNPLFVIPFAHIILKEKIHHFTILSLVISIAGLLFILNPFNMTSNIYGVIFALLSAMTFALYSVIGKTKSERYGSIMQTSFSFLAGSIELLILLLISKISFISNFLTNRKLSLLANIPIFKGITIHTLPLLIYLGIFATGLGYAFYFFAIEETSAATASLVFYIKPALAPVLALIILRESLAINTLIGIGLIVIGSSITFIGNKRLAFKEQQVQETI